MLRYAITDRRLFAADEAARTAALVAQVRRLVDERVDFLQLREKDLSPPDLLALARRLREVLPRFGVPKLLVNGPLEVAVRSAADGVHLPGSWTAADLLRLRYQLDAGGEEPSSGKPRHGPTLLSVACHCIGEVRAAALAGVDLILFSPVFEKSLRDGSRAPGTGLDQLQQAAIAAAQTPVLALGGVTFSNAAECLAHGASGIAGIRLFAAVN